MRKNMKWLALTLAVALIVAAGLIGCAAPAPAATPAPTAAPAAEATAAPEATPEATAAPVEITAYGVIDPQISSQQIIADKKGFFAEEGLKVTNQLIQSGSDMASLIAGNTAVVSFESNYTDISLGSNGIGIKMLAPMADIGGTQCVVARKGLAISSAKDLEGLKIGMAPGSGVLIAIRKMGEELGVDVSKLEFVALQPADQVAAIERGDIDLMACWEPWVGNAVAAGGTLLFSGTKAYLPEKTGDVSWMSFYTTFQVTDKFLADNPEAVAGMLRALNKATDFINNNREEAAEIIAAELNLEKDQVIDIMSKNSYSMEFGKGFVDATNEMAAFMLEMGNITKAPEFTVIADSAPLKAAVPELVTAE